MNKKSFIYMVVGLLLIGSVSAMSVNYYFHPQCSHCQEIDPFIKRIINDYSNINFDILDTSKASYIVDGTPTLVLTTEDNRKIKLEGSRDIPKYLECELNEKSTIECPTYSYLNCTTNSYFIR